MGTPCACVYATLFFAYFEQSILLKKFKKNLLFYRRQIDDIFAVWVPDNDNPTAWDKFQSELNGCCKLEWNTEPLSNAVNFLDLTVFITKDRKIKYRTYQKTMNQFLYIPAHSAHPPGVFKSLIYGLIQTYHRQNPYTKDFHNFVRLLFKRLLGRRHQRETLTPIFLDAIDRITQKSKVKNTLKTKNIGEQGKQLFFHLQYHPRGIARSKIQALYKEHCESPDNLGESFRNHSTDEGDTMQITKLTVAYSRAKNLRDVLSPSRLEEFQDCKVSNFIGITGRVD